MPDGSSAVENPFAIAVGAERREALPLRGAEPQYT